MRELKFRAWHRRAKKMYEVDNLGVNWATNKVQFVTLISKDPNGDVTPRLEVGKEVELMQFTGLLDKQGKEIYEGDIVESPSGKKQVVEYDARIAGFFPLRLFSFGDRRCKVIGNIMENPELLKEEK